MNNNELKILGQLINRKDSLFKKTPIKAKEQTIRFIDPANVFMIIPKNKETEATLNALYEGKKGKMDLKLKNTTTAKYSTEYLLKMIELANQNNDSVRLTFSTDEPLIMETEDYKMILAPRIGED